MMFAIQIFLIGGVNFLLDKIQYFIPQVPNIVEMIGIFYLTGWIFMGALRRIRKEKNAHLYRVCMKCSGKWIETEAFLDTGNQLFEPITEKPVSIIEESVIEVMRPYEQQAGFCVIPYHSLGKKNGMMWGFTIEEMVIRNALQERKLTEVVVGVYKGRISSDGKYQMILHPKLLEN